MTTEQNCGKQNAQITVFQASQLLIDQPIHGSHVLKGKIGNVNVAIKPFSVLNDEVKRFVQILNCIHHQNIVQFYGVCAEPYLFITELAEESLYHLLLQNERTLSTKRLIKIALQIARGMEKLHSVPLLHGNLHLKNILVTKNCNIKICDFGRSGEISQNKIPTIENLLYFAPETINGGEISLKSDVYSYGMVLWSIFEKSLPFMGKVSTIEELKHEVLLKNLRPSFTSPILSSRIKLLIESCWNNDPQSRLSFSEVIKELENEYLEMTFEAKEDRIFWRQCILPYFGVSSLTDVYPIAEFVEIFTKLIDNHNTKSSNSYLKSITNDPNQCCKLSDRKLSKYMKDSKYAQIVRSEFRKRYGVPHFVKLSSNNAYKKCLLIELIGCYISLHHRQNKIVLIRNYNDNNDNDNDK